MLDALSRDKVRPKRCLFVSFTAVCGNALTGPVSGDTESIPTSFTGRVMLEGEQLLRRRLKNTEAAGAVFRLSGVYGPGRTR
jgi:nucleoside-diphosphate-sugar epimerase